MGCDAQRFGTHSAGPLKRPLAKAVRIMIGLANELKIERQRIAQIPIGSFGRAPIKC